jgi:hypothetical protein
VSKEMGLFIEYICSTRHKETIDGLSRILPTGRQIP